MNKKLNYPLTCLKKWKKIKNISKGFAKVINKIEDYFDQQEKLKYSAAKSFTFPFYIEAVNRNYNEFSKIIRKSTKEKSVFFDLAKNISIIYGEHWATYNNGKISEIMDFSEFNVSWDSYDQMQMQVDLLDYGEVDRLNDEVVNNEDCYVLKILPDVDKLYEIMMNQQGLGTGVLQNSYLSDIIKDFSIKLWISKETNFIMKAYEYVSMEMTLYESTTSMTMETMILFTNYNTAIMIELPEDAENATSYLDIFSTISPA